MFKLVKLMAAFVVKHYRAEAVRLAKVVADKEARRDALLLELDEHANTIDGHHEAATEADFKAEQLADALGIK